MKVDVWSDVMCPWCSVGRANLLEALKSFDGENVQIRWRSFQLDPTAGDLVQGDYVQKLADKYGQTREQALSWISQMADRGAEVGVSFDFSKIRPGNTFKAHRLLHFAAEYGLQDALKARLFSGYFEEGVAVGTVEGLVGLAVDVGLDEDKVRRMLASDAYADDVRSDLQLAKEIGVTGVPFFVFEESVAVAGAHPPEGLLQAMNHAVEQRSDSGQQADIVASNQDGCALE
jgi:predicted DsbA family dithiol-disulfide isomerase